MKQISSSIANAKRLPFNWKTLIGYSLAILLELVLGFFMSIYINAMLSLAFGAFMFSIAFADDIIQELRAINKSAKTEKSESDVWERLNKIISLHTDMKQ